MGDNSDWYNPPPDSRALHFFPGWKVLIWLVNRRVELRATASGGVAAEPGRTYNTMKPQRTTPGNYVIYSVAPYVTKTWKQSRIAWGTRLRLSPDGRDLLYETGGSNPLWASATKKCEVTIDELRLIYGELYGTSGRYDPDGDNLPDRWIYSAFGPLAVRYFRDLNGNKRLDGKERLSGEMFHTSPDTEAAQLLKLPSNLGESHGCIHISPVDRDRFLKAHAFDRGVDLVIHTYEESVPEEWL
jgi:hypothetical protein